jgi:hypothetical protein
LHRSLQCAHEEVANKEHHQLTNLVALDVSHPLKSPSKEVAPLNIEDYMMDNATKQMSVMEGKEVNYTLSLQRVNEEVANEKHH